MPGFPVDDHIYIYIYIYMYIFHPRYLHNDIFRYMTCEITHDISAVLCKLITLVVIANFNCLGFLQLPSSGVPCSTGLEQLLKCRLGVWVAHTTNITYDLPYP